MNSKRQCDLFGHTASYINTSLQRLAIQLLAFVLEYTFINSTRNTMQHLPIGRNEESVALPTELKVHMT